MPKMKLTGAAVVELPFTAGGQQAIWYDTALRGFGLRVGASKKSYICETRVNGKTRRVVIGCASVFTADKARKEAQKLLGQMAGGTDVTAEKTEARAKTITLEEAQKAFFEGRKLKASTELDYRRVFAAYFPDWGKRQMKDITPANVLKRFQDLSGKSGEATANKAMRILGSLWNHARATTARNDGTHVLPENPVKRIAETKSWHKIKRRQGHLTGADFPAWFAAVHGLTSQSHPAYAAAFRDYCELLVRTGMRRNEAANLRWDNVSMTAKTFTIVAPKNGRDMTLPMSDQIFAIFERRKAAPYGQDAPVYVFPGAHGGALTDPRKFLDPIRQASGTSFTFHDLRRTFATLAERLDVSHYALKRLLNHIDSDVTAGYLIADPERLREPMQRISNEIDKLAKLSAEKPTVNMDCIEPE